MLLRHVDGALSSLVSSHCIQRYRRPGLEFYGTEGTANLLGDDSNNQPPKTIMRILHTMLRVGNLQRSIDFYTKVLGMKLLR